MQILPHIEGTGKPWREDALQGFADESESARSFEACMGQHFKLISEVWLRHMDGSKLRIDYVGYAHDPLLRGAWGLVGFEIKKGYEGIGGVSRALKQSVDYRHCILADDRINTRSGFVGKPLSFVFLWPPMAGFFERSSGMGQDPLVEGAIRLAGHYNVGVCGFRNYTEASALYVSGSRVWDSVEGPARNAADFGSGRGRGSA